VTAHAPATGLPSGVRIGHFTDRERATGCTVLLFEGGAHAGVHRFGPATATRHMDGFGAHGHGRPIHGLVLAGGSAWGLACSNGVMDVLRERGVGVPTRAGLVPRVPVAVIYDLAMGDPLAWPSAEDAARAAREAIGALPAEGSVGAGTGASVGKTHGPAWATKGGVGLALERVGDVTLAALVVVNAFGDVVDPRSGVILAGCRHPEEGTPGEAAAAGAGPGITADAPGDENTTLAVILTDAGFEPRELDYLASVASHGLARCLRPAATPFDGDLVFAVSSGERAGDLLGLPQVAADLVERAVLRAVELATPLHGVPACAKSPGVAG
jgi:L-aminopeptidase/D-esterase-like protein